MRTQNPMLLAEIDALEDITRKDANELEVVKELNRLQMLSEAALAYIDVSVCDPDINAEMWEAWQKLVELRK